MSSRKRPRDNDEDYHASKRQKYDHERTYDPYDQREAYSHAPYQESYSYSNQSSFQREHSPAYSSHPPDPALSWDWMIGRNYLDAPVQYIRDSSNEYHRKQLYADRGASYSRHMSSILSKDDLSSTTSQEYLNVTTQLSNKHTALSPHSSSSEQDISKQTTIPRQLIVLDLNGSLLFRDKGRPGSRPIFRRPYLTCFAQYLAHERTRNAVLVEQKSRKKKYHILPADVDFTSKQATSKRKGKKRHNTNENDDTMASLQKRLKKHPEHFILLAPLDAMVWSSVQPQNLVGMIDAAFGVDQSSLRACWTRRMLGLETNGYFGKVQTTKNLERIWWSSEDGYDAKSTVLMDDTVLKARLQPWNLLQVSEYTKEDVKKTQLSISMPTLKPVKEEESETEVDGVEAEAEAEAREEGVVDETLLAVIGILEEMRTQTNISAWIRNGGLWNGVESKLNGSSDPPDACTKDVQKVESTDDDDAIPGLDMDTNLASVLEEVDAVSSLWCGNPSVLSHWVERGKNTLKSRGIPINIGPIHSDSNCLHSLRNQE